jgi:hypothetical protein
LLLASIAQSPRESTTNAKTPALEAGSKHATPAAASGRR